MLGLALGEGALVARVAPELALRASSDDCVGPGKPYVDLVAAGGVGRSGAPEVPGSMAYARFLGEAANGFCCALMLAVDEPSWPRLAEWCNAGDLGVSILRGVGRSTGPLKNGTGEAPARTADACEGRRLNASGGKDGAGMRGDSMSETFLLRLWSGSSCVGFKIEETPAKRVVAGENMPPAVAAV